LYFCCEIICYFLLLLLLISCGHFFLHLWSWVGNNYVFVLPFSFALLFVFLLFRCLNTLSLNSAPPVPLYCFPWSSLSNMTIPVHLMFFFARSYITKHGLLSHCGIFLYCFFSPLRDHTPQCIHTYPSLPLCTRFEYFWQNSQNIMSGEISPAIVSQKYPARPCLALSALFLCPPVTPVSQHTHPHPFTPIFTCLNPFAP
jgi:hypothetical protein